MMKKFLSSLLALTMILSLVIVPANATGGGTETDNDGFYIVEGAPKITVNKDTVVVGEKVKFTANTDNIKVYQKDTSDNKGEEIPRTQLDFTYTLGSDVGGTAETAEVTASEGAESIKADLTVTVTTGSGNMALNHTFSKVVSKPVTVKAVPTISYHVFGDLSVDGPKSAKSGEDVTFTVNTKGLDYVKYSSDAPTVPVKLEKGEYSLSYAWTVNGESVSGNNTDTLKTKLGTTMASEKQNIACAVTVSFTGAPVSANVVKRATAPVTVSDPSATAAAKAQADFEAAVKNYTVKGRTYSINGGYYYTNDEVNDLDNPVKGGVVAVNPDASKYKNFESNYIFATKKLTVSAKVTIDGQVYSVTKTYTVTGEKVKPTVTINKPSGLTGSTVYVGSSYTFTPSFAESLYGSTSGVKYEWTVKGTDVKTSNSGNNYTVTPGKAGKITITLTATDRGNEEYKATLELTVEANPYTAVATGKTEFTINTNETLNLATSSAPALYKDYGTSSQEKIAKNVTGPKWESNDKTVATVTSNGVVKGLKSGTATITATLTYEGKDYPVEYKVRVSALDCKLDSVENGATVGYTRNDLMSAAEEAIYAFDRTRVDVTGVTVILPSGTSYGTFYDDEDCGRNDKVTGSYAMDSGDELYFKSENGYVGSDVKVTLNVKTRSDGDYSVTAVIPVTMRKGEFESQVTGSDKTYKVTVPSGYEAYWVLSTSKEPAASEYDGSWATKTAGKYTSKSLYSFSTSNLKDGEGKLYIVAIDDKGIAYSGVIELKANAYTIKYSVVAGESVTFDQKRFESFMEDYADDNIKTSKGDYFEFDYVKFTSLPNSTREGVLYEGKDKIKTSTEVENLDKVSFESVAKAKDTIKVPFTLYAKQYDKNDKVIDKKVSMTGVVEISVVKEDIVFEVGVNSAVKLGSDKFIDFLRDSDKSYRKADLDYVTFDVGKNSAITSYFNGTGALYRYYNGNTGINATVSAKDEFYYNPKTSSKHYDLDDVAYVTSKFAKVGDIVYIPFTAYGTKSGQKAEGTLAIKVKQTMNFVDVRPGDYFYDSVQWAVNLDITKGTSATTFSPKQGCTRAQIVTFLWRAANSPAPRSSTNKFTDVYATTHADYMKAIIWATEQGITTGTGNGKFSPDATCTRAQIVTFLYRFKSNPAVYGSLNFSDVNKTEHAAFYNAILWAVNNKITTGYGNGIFDPNGTCNRGDAVTFLYRALA